MIFVVFASVLSLVIITFLFVDYIGPSEIKLQSGSHFNMKCLRAKDLVVQEYDNNGNLWATRGMLIYRMDSGVTRFRKVARVPSGFSLFWLNNFRIIRMITLRSECVEMIVGENGSLCAFSSGRMWNSHGIGEPFRETFKLPNYGIKIGRGIMSTGLLEASDRKIYFGEYFNNPERKSVKIFEFIGKDKIWKIAHEFDPGTIRHIHALQSDCYSGNLWVCTGDEEMEPMIGFSGNGFSTISPVGQGSQKWRACQLVFTEEAVYWGADTGSKEFGGIYRLARETMSCEKLVNIPGAIFFGTRLANGVIVMSTDREGFPNELDRKTRLFLIGRDGKVISVECGTWNYDKPGFRFNFAKLRLQRNQGSQGLAITCLNQKEFPEGELLIFSEDEVNKCFLSQR